MIIRDSSGNYVGQQVPPADALEVRGGISKYELIPGYQNIAAVQSVVGTKRGVPDVALDADPDTGALIVIMANGVKAAAPVWPHL